MPDSKEMLVNTAPAKAGSIGHIRPTNPPLPGLLGNCSMHRPKTKGSGIYLRPAHACLFCRFFI